ncbi:MAG TPA: S9 family peptidase [Candidatus Eisenbacteria bacterium]|jgi:oligopeptidase B
MSGPVPVSAATPKPPVAEKRPHEVTLHGERLTDDYAWLRDKQDPKVIAYLEAENAYTDSLTHDQQPLRDHLYAEMLARIQQTDLSVPYRKGSWLYYTRTEEGKQYPIYCRKPVGADAAEQVLLDLNVLAEGHTFMAVGDFEVSPDERLLAYTLDDNGYRQYRLHVKDLATGDTLAVTDERVTSLAWTAQSNALFYTQEDKVSKRSYRLIVRELSQANPITQDEERDERFEVSVELTRSGEWLVYTIRSHTTSEVRVLRADQVTGQWVTVAPRVQDREYYVDHRRGDFWIRVNDTGRNFRLVTAPTATPDPAHWTEVVPHRDDVMLTNVECFAHHVVLTEREHALPQITVLEPEKRRSRRVSFPEVAYTVGPATNAEYDPRAFRYAYQSFIVPPSVYDLDLATLESKLLKRTAVLGGWDATHYAMERTSATASDGTKIPLTLLYRKGFQRNGAAPCLLYAYGSYGLPSNVTFSSARFSLVDRGVVYALAHVRGGGDLGKKWHDAGRMRNKMNTFTDFIACAEFLERERYCSPRRLVIQGGSAGGLLVGAVTNLRPDLFTGVLAQVPFVDILNTMLDESLPLTVGEFEEWGNPKLEADWAVMRRYSPYDNLAPRAYPAMLVKTSLNDSQVGYWEPAKYVARLRAVDTGGQPVLFKCNMGAGHGGASGRYDALHDVAFDYAWILGTLGVADARPTP